MFEIISDIFVTKYLKFNTRKLTRISYKDINVDADEMCHDHQQDPLEEEILVAVGEPDVLRPYLSGARLDRAQKINHVIGDAAADEVPRRESHDSGEDQRGDVVPDARADPSILAAKYLPLEGVPQAPALRRKPDVLCPMTESPSARDNRRHVCTGGKSQQDVPRKRYRHIQYHMAHCRSDGRLFARRSGGFFGGNSDPTRRHKRLVIRSMVSHGYSSPSSSKSGGLVQRSCVAYGRSILMSSVFSMPASSIP